jgi:hypothetical protein
MNAKQNGTALVDIQTAILSNITFGWVVCQQSLQKNQILCKKPFAQWGDWVIVPSNDAGKNKNKA